MIKILGKINLENLPKEKPRFRAEKYKPFLDEKMSSLALKLNNEYGNIFKEDASVDYKDEDDESFVLERENEWSRQVHKDRKTWLKDKEVNKATLAETGISLLFDKAVGDKFVIAKASDYDDYKNGVDNIILDKETGNVVCGFDDVLGNRGDDGGEKKSQKITEIMKKGGASLKHGLKFNQENKLNVSNLENLPAFYLSLSTNELQDLLESLMKDDENISDTEKKTLNKFINSMQEQIQEYDKLSLNQKLADNLNEFKNSIEKIKEII